MKLQIFITHYKESEDIVRPLLTSLNAQQCVNFNDFDVILYNDGRECILSNEFLSEFKNLHMTYVLGEHYNISVARNNCIKLATGDYIMFCDCDDMFVDLLAINKILKILNENDYDIVTSDIYHDFPDKYGKLIYEVVRHDATFIHCKSFKRQYLLDNDIWFNEKLHIQEDIYFCRLSMHGVKGCKKYRIDTPMYLYKYRPDSVAREKDWLFRTRPKQIECFDELCTELSLRKSHLSCGYHIAVEFVDLFIENTYYKTLIGEPGFEWIEPTMKINEECFSQFVHKFKIIWDADLETVSYDNKTIVQDVIQLLQERENDNKKIAGHPDIDIKLEDVLDYIKYIEETYPLCSQDDKLQNPDC